MNTFEKSILYGQSGGKLLSSGAYGCVYYPSINCEGEERKTKKYVSKIQRKDEASKNEMVIGTLIQSISDYKMFFVPVLSECDIGISKLESGKLEHCDIFKKRGEAYTIMKMKYVKGKTYFDYITSLKKEGESAVVASDVKQRISEKKLMLTVIDSFTYLLNGLYRLLTKNIVHYDLKGNNILYDAKKNHPIIIDFGLSINVKNLNSDNMRFYFYTYTPDYYVWCPEIHFISYLNQKSEDGILREKEVKQITSDIVKKNKPLKRMYSKCFLEKYRKALAEYYKKYIGQSKSYVENDLLQHYATWDNYSLSIMYLRILHYLFPDGFMKNGFITSFSQILLQNIHPNPERRLTIHETIEAFGNELIRPKKDKASDFKMVLDSLQNKT